MTSFTYTYRDNKGILSSKTLQSKNRKQALITLRKLGIIALKLEESKPGLDEKALNTKKLIRWTTNKTTSD